jgi:hypothetical protein
MIVMIAYPWLAGVLAGCFAGMWWYRRRRMPAIAAAAWALYMVYEYLMYARVLCSGECNIRVDLLLLYPLLLVLSVVAVVRGR